MPAHPTWVCADHGSKHGAAQGDTKRASSSVAVVQSSRWGEFSSSGPADSERPPSADTPASTESSGARRLIRALPELAQSVRAAMHDPDSEAFGSSCTDASASQAGGVPEGSASGVFRADSLPQLAKALQAKVRELTRMHEARAGGSGLIASASAGVPPDADHRRPAAAGDAATEDSGAALMCVEAQRDGPLPGGEAGRVPDSACSVPTVHGAAAEDSESVVHGGGVGAGETAGGALTHGEADELHRRNDTAAVHAMIDSLAVEAARSPRGGGSSDGGSDGGGGMPFAPGMAAEMAAQLSGLLVREDSGESGRGAEVVEGPSGADPGGSRRSEDRRSLRRELHEVRGVIEEMRRIRDAVAAGELSRRPSGGMVRSWCPQVQLRHLGVRRRCGGWCGGLCTCSAGDRGCQSGPSHPTCDSTPGPRGLGSVCSSIPAPLSLPLLSLAGSLDCTSASR